MRSHSRYLHQFRDICSRELREKIIPFWENHAIDWEKGGILSCISDEGKVLNRNRYMWSQLRGIWTFSALYNKVDKKQKWLDIAWNIYRFSEKYGRDKEGRWYFAVDEEGQPIEGTTSIFTEGFAVYGLVELARATGEKEPLDLALHTFHVTEKYLQKPGSYTTAPYPLHAEMKSHAVAMLFALSWFELAHLTDEEAVYQRAEEYARQVMEEFLRPEYNLVLEYISRDGSIIPSPQGKAVVPGHAIESMWFIIKISEALGKKEWITQAVDSIRRHVEFGWDKEYGGLLLGRDADGEEPWWPYAESKLWWPHTESLVALLYAYRHCKESWCLSWLKEVEEYAWKHFRRPHLQEWIQKLDRQGRVLEKTVALPVKDPFHLPRALIYCLTLIPD